MKLICQQHQTTILIFVVFQCLLCHVSGVDTDLRLGFRQWDDVNDRYHQGAAGEGTSIKSDVKKPLLVSESADVKLSSQVLDSRERRRPSLEEGEIDQEAEELAEEQNEDDKMASSMDALLNLKEAAEIKNFKGKKKQIEEKDEEETETDSSGIEIEEEPIVSEVEQQMPEEEGGGGPKHGESTWPCMELNT
jgi:hypothetical protein